MLIARVRINWFWHPRGWAWPPIRTTGPYPGGDFLAIGPVEIMVRRPTPGLRRSRRIDRQFWRLMKTLESER